MAGQETEVKELETEYGTRTTTVDVHDFVNRLDDSDPIVAARTWMIQMITGHEARHTAVLLLRSSLGYAPPMPQEGMLKQDVSCGAHETAFIRPGFLQPSTTTIARFMGL